MIGKFRTMRLVDSGLSPISQKSLKNSCAGSSARRCSARGRLIEMLCGSMSVVLACVLARGASGSRLSFLILERSQNLPRQLPRSRNNITLDENLGSGRALHQKTPPRRHDRAAERQQKEAAKLRGDVCEEVWVDSINIITEFRQDVSLAVAMFSQGLFSSWVVVKV